MNDFLPEGMYLHKDKESLWPASANVLLVRDLDGAWLVDVGCGHEETYLRLKDFIIEQGLGMEDIHSVVLTHAHPDHMGAMRFLLEEISPRIFLHPVEIPLAAQPSRLNETFDIGLPYEYGIDLVPREQADILEYFRGLCPMAGASATDAIEIGRELKMGRFRFQPVLTPGHANGLVSLFEPESGLLFTADCVGEVIAWYSPSSGGLTGFLQGLDRLLALPASMLLPSHGGMSGDPRAEIEKTRTRLLRREENILAQLSRGGLGFPELARAVFKNPLLALFPGPQMLQCHLDKLQAEEKVRCYGPEEGWRVELAS